MPIVLSDLLTAPEAAVLHQAASSLTYENGRKTAGRIAAAAKDNLQAVEGAQTEAVLAKVRSALSAHPMFSALAYPRGFARMLVSKTEGGGQYGDHIDNAIMGGMRTDLSFTLFLTPAEDYDGGALVVSDRIEERRFKLGQGEMILYPSTSLHRVETVTRGARVVVVGWITSLVRDAAQREILFDLWRAAMSAEAAGDVEQGRLLSKSRSNLLRMWVA